MSEDFYINIYEIVRSVPFGRVTTYGAIANALGVKKSSQLAGMVMNQMNLFVVPLFLFKRF